MDAHIPDNSAAQARSEELEAGFRLAAAGTTDVGLRRSENQDAILITPTIFAVADGMGGHEAGELASALAVETLEELIFLSDRTPEKPLPTQEQVRKQMQSRLAGGESLLDPDGLQKLGRHMGLFDRREPGGVEDVEDLRREIFGEEYGA